MESLEEQRQFLKAHIWELWANLETDQRKGLPPPERQKPCPEGASLVELVAPDDLTVGTMPLIDVIRRRRSRRHYTTEPLTLEQLSFLLWATQGMSGPPSRRDDVMWDDVGMRRTAPSGGGRHPFESYLLVRRVEGLEPGLYRYLPLVHKLCFLRAQSELDQRFDDSWGWRRALREGAVIFIWTVLPYRTEWRYGAIAPKIITLDAGHLCENLYLACEAIGCGTCAVVEYNQQMLDAMLELDGESEFVFYLAPVGRPG